MGNWLQSRLAYKPQACVAYGRVCCQGVYHLSPTLSESRGVINCSGNANPASHSDLLSTQHGASTADPPVSGTPGPSGQSHHICRGIGAPGQVVYHPGTLNLESDWHAFGQKFCGAGCSEVSKAWHLHCGS